MLGEGNSCQTFVTNAVTTLTSYPDSTVACTKQEVKMDGCPIRTTSQICIDPHDPDSLVTTITKTIDCTGKVTQTQFNITPRLKPGRGVTIVQNAPPSDPSLVPCSNSQGAFPPCTPLKHACNPSFLSTPNIPIGVMVSEPCTLAQGGVPHFHVKGHPTPTCMDSNMCVCPPFVTASWKQSGGPAAGQESGPGEMTMCACPPLIPQDKNETETECGCPIGAKQQKSCPIIPEHIHIKPVPCGLPSGLCPPLPCYQPRNPPTCPSVPCFPLQSCSPPLFAPPPCSLFSCSPPPCSPPPCSQSCIQPVPFPPICMTPPCLPPSCVQPPCLAPSYTRAISNFCHQPPCCPSRRIIHAVPYCPKLSIPSHGHWSCNAWPSKEATKEGPKKAPKKGATEPSKEPNPANSQSAQNAESKK